MGKWFPGVAATLLVAMAGGLWHLSGETADTTRRVTTVEERVKEDRKDTRQNINEVKEHVKAIDQNVQVILQKITAMEAVQKSERRRER